MTKMCFFDESNNNMIVNTFKVLKRRDREKLFMDIPINRCIPKGYSLQ